MCPPGNEEEIEKLRQWVRKLEQEKTLLQQTNNNLQEILIAPEQQNQILQQETTLEQYALAMQTELHNAEHFVEHATKQA